LECDGALLRDYVQRRVRSKDGGALKRWNVAIIGNPLSGDPDKRYEFVPGIAVDRVIRAKLEESGSDAADIKTLMSRRDAGVDLDLDGLSEITEDLLKRARREQMPDTGLLTLYPIDARSPSPTNRQKRSPLDAVDHVIGVGLVFPTPSGDDDEVEYWSADLSRVQDEEEEEDLSMLFEEDDS
jgi:hypothetical protein